MTLIEGIKVDGGVVKDTLGAVGGLFKDIRSAITGKIDPDKEAELTLKIAQAETALLTTQAEINKIEAANPNLFVSGWRPAVGWCCVLGLLYAFLVQPVLSWASVNFKWLAPPIIDTAALYQLLLALLGLGVMRSYEKKTGVARN